MDKNIGTIDRMIRFAGLLLAATIYITHIATGILETAAGIFTIYFFMTALTQYSPIWEIFGISTLKWKPFGVRHHVFQESPENKENSTTK